MERMTAGELMECIPQVLDFIWKDERTWKGIYKRESGGFRIMSGLPSDIHACFEVAVGELGMPRFFSNVTSLGNRLAYLPRYDDGSGWFVERAMAGDRMKYLFKRKMSRG